MDNEQAVVSNLLLELRRGVIVLSVLSQLKSEKYGYSLVQSLEDKGFAIDPSTLYPLLRRLEKQGVLSSEWETSGAKPRKYYQMTESGLRIYHSLHTEWRKTVMNLEALLQTGGYTNGEQ